MTPRDLYHVPITLVIDATDRQAAQAIARRVADKLTGRDLDPAVLGVACDELPAAERKGAAA